LGALTVFSALSLLALVFLAVAMMDLDKDIKKPSWTARFTDSRKEMIE